MKVLVTGAAGSIGQVVLPGLAARGHYVTGLDLPGRGADLEADCTDPVAVDTVLDRLRPEAVVHLAGFPGEASLQDSLTSHVVTTAALLESMVRYGVRRFVYASSNHAVGRTPRAELGATDGILGTDVSGRPDTFYGTAKVAAEGLLRLYVDRYGVDVVSTRIGSFLPRPTTRRQLWSWLSHDDAVRMFHAAVTTETRGYQVVHGVSANTRGWWDLKPGRDLGYFPQDDAERFAAEVEAVEESDDDRGEDEHVGGPYATDRFERPAFDAVGPT